MFFAFDRLILRFDWVENSISPDLSSTLISILLSTSNTFFKILPERLDSIFILSEYSPILPSSVLFLMYEFVFKLNSLLFLIKLILELT